MLTKVVIFYILYNIEAPTWAFVIIAIAFLFDIIKFGIKMYEQGLNR